MRNPRTQRNHGGFATAAIEADDDSLEERVGKNVVLQLNGCWYYRGVADEYQSVNGEPAHRWFYKKLRGPIPAGYHVHHECENKGCVNPRHLSAITPSVHSAHHNAQRRARRSA